MPRVVLSTLLWWLYEHHWDEIFPAIVNKEIIREIKKKENNHLCFILSLVTHTVTSEWVSWETLSFCEFSNGIIQLFLAFLRHTSNGYRRFGYEPELRFLHRLWYCCFLTLLWLACLENLVAFVCWLKLVIDCSVEIILFGFFFYAYLCLWWILCNG